MRQGEVLGSNNLVLSGVNTNVSTRGGIDEVLISSSGSNSLGIGPPRSQDEDVEVYSGGDNRANVTPKIELHALTKGM